MELIFNGKRSKIEILNEASTASPINIDQTSSYLIHGDNFDIMAGMLNGCGGLVDLIYIDPPFNTNQTFSISANRVSTVSRSSDGIVAYSDFMSDDEYLQFMYDRFVLMYELLSDEGSIYVHIDTKNGHYLKVILDEIFGAENFKNDITRIKSNPKNFDRNAYGNEKDMILFYSKNRKKNIWNEVRIPLTSAECKTAFPQVDENGRKYTTIPLHAPGETQSGITGMSWRGMLPPPGRHWRTSPEEFDRMDAAGDIEWSSTGNPRIKKYADEHRGKKIQDVWTYKDPQKPKYPTQKNPAMIKAIISQSSRQGGLVMDCFAGSGTTALAAAELGRRFIAIDSSEIAVKIMKSEFNECERNYIFIDRPHKDTMPILHNA